MRCIQNGPRDGTHELNCDMSLCRLWYFQAEAAFVSGPVWSANFPGALRTTNPGRVHETERTRHGMGSVYDLMVIGSGPAGQRAAIYGSKLGKKIALVEMREGVGGACINTGTIPSKTMREAVLHLSGYNYKSIYGMNYRVKEKITMADLAFRVQHVIKTEVDVTEAQLSRNNIEMLVGIASFQDANHVKVTNSRGSHVYETRNVLIATGTKPAASAKVPINGRSIINSDQVLELPSLPKSLIVVGGGVIGVEYTCMFSALGVRVTLIEKRPKLLEFADQHIVEALSYHLRDSR